VASAIEEFCPSGSAEGVILVRLVHVAPTYWPAFRYGGPIWAVHSLCKALVRRDHQVKVFTTNVDGPDALDVDIGRPVNRDGVSVHYFPPGFGRRLFRSPRMNAQLQAAVANAEFIHLHYIFVWPTLATARLAESHSVPWCVSPHGALVPELVKRKSRWAKYAWLSLFGRYTLENAAFIHATSNLEAEDARRFGYDLPPIRVVPIGVDLPVLKAASDVPADISLPAGQGPLLLFLSRISWKKGLDRLIPALARIPAARLVVAGNDEENLTSRLISLARKVGVADRLVFAGPVYGEKKDALLRSASLLVLPSHSENFGIVVLESLAMGRPVAVTAEVGLASVVKTAGVGEIIPSDPIAMGDAIAELVKDPARLNEMGERGRALVASRYSWDTIAQEMEAAYAEAIAKKPKMQ